MKVNPIEGESSGNWKKSDRSRPRPFAAWAGMDGEQEDVMGFDGKHHLVGVKLVNLIPHAVTVRRDGQEDVVIPPSGQVARVTAKAAYLFDVNGIAVVRASFGAVEGLPPVEIGTMFVVSILVVQALAGRRNDLLAPDTGPESAIRDGNGKVVAVRRFQVF